MAPVLLSFCNPFNEQKNNADDNMFGYSLDHPDKKIKLPSYLEEISGISFYGNEKIACIQDEKAYIYVLSLKKEDIIKKHDFGENADYEDLVIIGSSAYILRSNGEIYRVEDFKKKSRNVKKIKTALREKNDTEGMAYDALSNSLLITCKESPSINDDNKYDGYKAVYRFDIEEEELDKKPYFLIDLNRLDSYIDRNSFVKLSLKVAKSLRLVESETSFKPSGISIHPISGDVYIISSVGKLLIILNQNGKVKDVKELDPKIFRQPEGICFSPDGDMFISSEGQGGKGYILKFEYNYDE